MIPAEISRLAEPTDWILDVGSKDGRKGQDLPGRVVGIDLRRQYFEGDYPFVCGDATELPFSDGFFSYIMLDQVLEHVRDKHSLIAELRRVLRSDGTLFVAFPNRLLLTRPHETPRWFSVLPTRMAHAIATAFWDENRAQNVREFHFPTSPWGARRLLKRVFHVVEYRGIRNKLLFREIYLGTEEYPFYQARLRGRILTTLAPVLDRVHQIPLVDLLLESLIPNPVYECRVPRRP